MSPLDLFIDAAVFSAILFRQRRPRRVRLHFAHRVPVLLLCAGLLQFVSFTETHTLGAAVSAVVLGGCVVGGALFGVLRAITVRLFPLAKGVGQQATWLTISLWVASAAAYVSLSPAVSALHGPLDVLAGSFVLFLAFTQGVQNTVVHHRAVQWIRRGGGGRNDDVIDARSWEAQAT